jgi:hypothetical protein
MTVEEMQCGVNAYSAVLLYRQPSLSRTEASRYELATKQEGMQFCKPPPHQQWITLVLTEHSY